MERSRENSPKRNNQPVVGGRDKGRSNSPVSYEIKGREIYTIENQSGYNENYISPKYDISQPQPIQQNKINIQKSDQPATLAPQAISNKQISQQQPITNLNSHITNNSLKQPQTTPLNFPVSTNTSSMLPDDDDSSSQRYKIPTFAPLPIPGLPQSYGHLVWSQKHPIPAPQVQFKDIPDSTPSASNEQISIDIETAKKYFIKFSRSNCCYGKNPANFSEIQNIISLHAFHYTLETFTQKRSVQYTYTAYKGEPLDSFQMGQIPEPWAINCNSNGDFIQYTRHIRVPHTEQIMVCFRCNGHGNLRCSGCSGSGKKKCTSCHGSGQVTQRIGDKTQSVRCTHCSGSGKTNCIRCGGKGYMKCSLCNGSTRLKCFLELEVSFNNIKDDYVNQTTELPDELIKTASGELILNQTAPQLMPINNLDNKQIVANSINLFNQHRNRYSLEMPILQRQKLSLVPVTECKYMWKNFNGKFWIYGREMHVFCDDYPQKCCGCCCCCGGCCDLCKCCNCSIQ